LKSIADEEFMIEHHLTDWAAAPAEQQELRQKEHTAAKVKCVQEQAALAKASRNVVDFVGNMEVLSWSDENKESVEAYAIELRHQLDYHMQHRVKHPPCPQQWSTSGTKPHPQPRTRMQKGWSTPRRR
jgi:hypothetical protein